jgi:precorrin-2 dehydrogenase/sirohydrochlorin ferrochelatase
MKYYPMYVDLRDKKCVVIGGGPVAERKVKSLLDCGANITVISPQLGEALRELAQERRIKYLRRTYRRGDLEGAFLAISATDRAELNAIIYGEAIQKEILINVVDDPEKCTYIVPSVLQRGDLAISISTAGSCPALSKKIRLGLEREFGEEYCGYLEILQEAREQIKQKYRTQEERTRILNRVLKLDILPLIREGKRDLAEKRVTECI